MPEYILGLNAYHGDASAVLLRDRQFVCAIAEERLRRIKHWAGFPTQAIQVVLNDVGITGRDISHVAISRRPSAHQWRKLLYVARRRPSLGFVRERLHHARTLSDIGVPLAQALDLEVSALPTVHEVEHHRAHLASAFYAPSFSEAACLALDGFGDFVSTSFGVGHGTSLDIIDRVYFPHSLGIFYSAITQFLGFRHYGDEYKVMALAAYGKPTYLTQLQSLITLADRGFTLDLKFFRHWSPGVSMEWEDGAPTIDTLYAPALEMLLGPARNPQEAITDRVTNIASSLQAVYEEACFHVLRQLWDRTRLPRLCLAGGCALNASANGKIRAMTPFREVYVPPAAGDDGTALGAAWSTWYDSGTRVRAPGLSHAYWGPARGNRLNGMSDVIKTVAKYLAEGQIIGWYQGRSEWGARALGHRSILADPRRAEIRDAINARVKHREWFRPFAPSVTIEAFDRFFREADPDAFMTQVATVREERRAEIPAVVHVDGTARVQAVGPSDDPVFYELLTEFGRLTGVPILLNTSLNEQEPIVETPEQAFDCFTRASLDAIVIDLTIFRKSLVSPLRQDLDPHISTPEPAGAVAS